MTVAMIVNALMLINFLAVALAGGAAAYEALRASCLAEAALWAASTCVSTWGTLYAVQGLHSAWGVAQP
jgi:hypothetical protein